MKKLLPIMLLAIIFAFACSESTEKKENNDQTKDNDTIDSALVDEPMITLEPEVEEIAVLFEENLLPVTIDSTYIESVLENEHEPLKTAQVKLLTEALADNDLNNPVSWDIKNFYDIDSLKENGLYEEYLANIDIGMMKESDVFAIDWITVDDKTSLLIWVLNYSSYEACPYSAGTIIMATVIFNGSFTDCHILGEEMGAGDPPVGMDRFIYSEIQEDGTGKLDSKETMFDEDENWEPIEETTKKGFKLKIVEGKILTETK